MSRFQFTRGPQNASEAIEAFCPGIRPTIDIEEKLKKLAEIGLPDVQFHNDDAMRDMKVEEQCRHIQNSMAIALELEKKVDTFDFAFQTQCIAERNYEKFEMYVMEHPMGLIDPEQIEKRLPYI